MAFLQILPLLNYHKSTPEQVSKIHTINFRLLRQKCVLLPESCFGVEQILQQPTSKYPQIENIFHHWVILGHHITFCSYDVNFLLHQCEPVLFWLMKSSN